MWKRHALRLVHWPFRSLRRAITSTTNEHLARMPSQGAKVLVAMSGGVDSTVSAHLLKAAGCQVEGVYMKNWDETDETGVCQGEAEWEKTQSIAHHLDIPMHRVSFFYCFTSIKCPSRNEGNMKSWSTDKGKGEQMDFVKEYWSDVFQALIDGYSANETPNPDILCNAEIKFGSLLAKVLPDAPLTAARPSHGFFGGASIDYVATGHYCGLSRDRAVLLRGADARKDQSYFLSTVPRQRLKQVHFPLQALHKSEVKRMAARDIGLESIASQRESMGICFIGQRRRFQQFLASYLPPVAAGPYVDAVSHRTLGEHQGAVFHTIGQGARISGLAEKWFVLAKDLQTNTVFVVPGSDHPRLYTRQISMRGTSPVLQTGKAYFFQCRHGQKAQRGVITDVTEHITTCLLDRPMRAVTPGQYVAIYDELTNQYCLDGLPICATSEESVCFAS